jgi:hypothetical protein
MLRQKMSWHFSGILYKKVDRFCGVICLGMYKTVKGLQTLFWPGIPIEKCVQKTKEL